MNDDRTSQSWLMPFAVWASFFLYGAIAAPVPGVNEPHYLCKSKHFWQPTWCARDFFLASPNAHTVFYATVGSLTRVLTLDQSAWIGRLLACALLTWGWIHCLSRILLTRWAPLWAAWIYLAISVCGNFSGEWLVGGVEGKVFAYALLMLAFGDLLLGRTKRAAVFAGGGISFHPVVGVWSLLAFAAAHFLTHLLDHRRSNLAAIRINVSGDGQSVSTQTQSPGRTPLAIGLCRSFDPVALILLVVCSLPGMVPVFKLLTESVPEQTKFAAAYLQVFYRLPHHLDPMVFPGRAYCGYAVLIAIWVSSFFWGGRTNSKRSFDRVVFWSIVIAVAGIAVGFGPRPLATMPYYRTRIQLLKFYPFRLADLLVPIAVAISLVSVFERTMLNFHERRSLKFSVPHSILLAIFLAALWRVHLTTEANRESVEFRTDWLEACRWIDDQLPVDALVQTPKNSWAFKWYAQRAEYVTFKDCPQDATGIVEWNNRLTFERKWYEQKYADGVYSAAELKELRQQTGLTHILAELRLGPFELEPVFRNGTFKIYDLRTLDD